MILIKYYYGINYYFINLILILAPQANVYGKENNSSMQYLLNQILLDENPSDYLVIDRNFIDNYKFRFKVLKKTLSINYILRYWYISLIIINKFNPNKIISISQEYILPFYKNKQFLLLLDLIQFYRPRNIFYYIFYKFYIVKTLPKIKKIFAISKYSARIASKISKVNFSDIEYIEIDKNICQNIQKKYIKSSKKIYDLLWIGTESNHKRLKFFIETLVILARSLDKKLTINIILPTNVNDEILDTIKKQKIDQKFNIFFKSNLNDEDINYLYSKSKILVSTSEIEGYCLPLRESYYFGCSCIAPNKQIFRELHQNYTKLFSPYSKLSLSQKIQEALAKGNFSSNQAIKKVEPISKIRLDNFLDKIKKYK